MITELSQLDLSKQYTYADYLTWQIKERVELLRGYIYKMSPAPNRYHQRISWNLQLPIAAYLKNKKCQAYSAPFDVRLSHIDKKINAPIITVVQPDICIICDLTKLDKRGCLGAPDWVIEILSEGNSRKEMKQKKELYEESGVGEYWIIQPEYENILVYLLQDNGKYVMKTTFFGDETVSPFLFPDLEIDLSEVFDSGM